MIESFIVISGIIAFISVLKEIKNIQIIFWMFILCLIVFDGLRWEMGTDWTSYFSYFKNAHVYDQPGFEHGFLLYTYIIRNLTDNYSVYLLITTAFIYIGIFYTVFKITNYSFLSIFFLTAVIPWYSGSLRQMMACVFFTLAIKSTMDKKLLHFIVLSIMGLLFHTTMIVTFPIYWIYGLSFLALTIIFFSLAVGSIFSKQLILILDWVVNFYGFNRSYSARLGGGLELSQPILGFLRKFITLSGLLYFSYLTYRVHNIHKDQWDKIKLTLFLSSLSVIFYYIGTFHIDHVSSRLNIYTGIISTAILVGLLDKSLNKKSNRILLYVFVWALQIVLYSRLELMSLFHPYSSIFYNYELHRILF